MVHNAFADDPAEAQFTLWAEAHEVLAITAKGLLYVTQRPEVSCLKDYDDGRRSSRLRMAGISVGITMSMHLAQSLILKVTWVVFCLTVRSVILHTGVGVYASLNDGKFIPTASGIRFRGIGMNCAGEVFFCDNQGPGTERVL